MLQSNTWTSRIVIYTLITNTTWWDPSTTRVLSNRDRYCIKWGCEQYFQTKSRASHPVWQKAFDAKELVEMYDWIWLLDATDAFIMNGDIDLRVLLGNLILEVGHEHADIVISRDWNGFNAGSFFLRSSDWTRQVFIPRWIQDEKRDLYYREQGSISQMWKNDEIGIRRHLVDLEYERSTLINSYYFGKVGNVRNWYQKGHFVLHAPGNRGIVKWLMENNQTEY
ncbi:hypothetical protein BCR33DRAFT_435288 [Rhizoclosmatium globosum]|uniref:Nucleotide-diphospho-sugar transferase domain-containing protein n=1 Tax=Rhizoclosmatium globosum TaxID=329046 RepID=A0A1Y2BU16_9FUNG|nr:hypothetical protein BCR33DRAFT_435288 [Rhizoclosmatium globosum]|eukprot:ORY38241.1 hypothetical protein BCR33DRAFT_435288 [Rhizoclosmatium globosum]